MPPGNQGQGQGPQATFTLNFDAEAFRAEMTRAANIFADQFEAATRNVVNQFNQAFNQINANLRGAFAQQAATAQQAGAQAGQTFGNAFAGNVNITQSLEQQIQALQRTSNARGDLLQDLGFDRNLFAGVDTQIQELVAQIQDLRRAQGQLTPEEFLSYTRAIEAGVGTARGELRTLEATLRQALQESARQQSANTAVFQQETTLQNALIRTQAQTQIQESQRAGRARIEFARFTYRQILFFEQQIARAIRGTFSAVGTLAGGAASAVARLGSIFRRSTRDVNDGFAGALRARESSLERSFRRQTNTVATQVGRQSQILDRFEAQSSRGVAGLLSGRGRLGLLIGGGLAAGAGFRIAQGLRAGFEEAVNLNEAMNAVEQIFGSATDAVVEFSENSVDALFLTQSEALKAAQNFGVFGKSAGLVGDELSDFSNTLTLLATDLASFYNTTVPDAVTAISAALRGEQEPIRRFGVLLDQQILRQTALAEGIINTDRQLTPSERVLAAYSEILAQTADAQGDAARTADDFANSSRRARAASVTFYASLVDAAVPVAEVLLKGINPALEGLTDFVNNNVNPALQTLRTGLIGAAVALGGLLAFRGAVELLQFLGIAARAALTPFGLLVTAVAGAGAAIAILRDQSPRAAAAFDFLRERGVELLGRGLEFVANVATRIVDVFRNVVIPVLVGVAAIVARNVGPAFQFVAGIIQDRVLPVLARVGGIILNVFDAVIPVISAAIGQIVRFGQAIGRAFTGDFGGLADIGRDILGAFANLGQLIVDFIRPQLQRAVDFIVGVFNGINWTALGLRALEFIAAVGFVIGQIASDPRFITALAAVAAAAAAVVGSFIGGVVAGIVDNRDELVRLLNDGLEFVLSTALELAFSNLDIVALLAVGGFLLNGVVQAFRQVGRSGGKGLVQGLQESIRTAPIRQFFPALFRGAETTFANAGRQAGLRFSREFNKISQQIFDLSGQTAQRARRQAGFIGPVPIDERDVAAAKRQLEELNATLTDTQRRALLIRGAWTRAFDARTVSGFATAVRTTVSTINWGALGRSAGSGFLFGYSAVISGRQGGTEGLVGVISSAIAAGVTTGNAFVAAAVGTVGLIALAWDKVTESGRKAAAAAKEFAEEVARLRDELEGLSRAQALEVVARELADSIKEGVGSGAFLAGLDLVAQAESAIETGRPDLKRAFDTVFANIGEDISFLELNRQFGAVGVNGVTAFRNIEQARRQVALRATERDTKSFTQEELELLATLSRVETALASQGGELSDLSALYNVLTGATGTFAEAAADAAVTSTWNVVAEDAERAAGALAGVSAAAQDAVGANSDAARSLSAAASELDRLEQRSATRRIFEETVSLIERAGGSLLDTFTLAVETARRAGENIDLDFLIDLIAGTTGADEATVDFNASILENARRTEEMREAWNTHMETVKEWELEANKVAESLTEITTNSGLVEAAIESLDRQRTDRIQGEIDALTERLDSARDAADAAREALTDFITGNYQDTVGALVDDLIGELPGIAEGLAEATQQGGLLGQAAFRSILGDLDEDIARIVQAGFEQGLSGAEIAAALAPLTAATSEVINPLTAVYDPDKIIVPPEIANRITGQIQQGVDPKQIDIGIQAIFNADAQVRAIQDELDARRAQLDTEIIFSDAQVQAELERVGLARIDAELVLSATPASEVQGDPLSQAVNNFQTSLAEVLIALAGLGAPPAGANTPQPIIENLNQIFPPSDNPELSARRGADGIVLWSGAAGGAPPPPATPVYGPTYNIGGGGAISVR